MGRCTHWWGLLQHVQGPGFHPQHRVQVTYLQEGKFTVAQSHAGCRLTGTAVSGAEPDW